MTALASLLIAVTLGFESEPDAGLAGFADLSSPWFEDRSAAQRKLLDLRVDEGAKVARLLLDSDDPRLRLAGVEWNRQRLRLDPAAPVDRPALLAAFEREKDPVVRDRFLGAFADLGDVVATLGGKRAGGALSPAEHDRLLDARLIRLCEQSMHDGGVPGFFDGQFAAMHALDPSALLRMCAFAWDPRVHPVPRTLMVMALHEPRPPQLRSYLEPLLLPAATEIEIQQGFNDVRNRWANPTQPQEIRLYLRANISQYSRFAMAKAGIAEPIDEKIALLRALADRKLQRALSVPFFGARDERPSLDVEEAMEYLFELGYHHQQLDRYDAAAAAYREIIDSKYQVQTLRWAHYNLACIAALTCKPDAAIDELRKAVESGFSDLAWAKRDGDLKTLRGDPRFERILAGAPAQNQNAVEVPTGAGR